MSDDNKVWKVIGIFLCCLLCICCIGVIGWYLYILSYGTEKMIVGTVNNSVLEKADGSSAYIIEIDYKSNANNNGLELFDLKLNYFTDETREYVYSKGLQYVANSPSDKIEWVEVAGAEDFDKYLDEYYDKYEIIDVLTPILSENMTFYTVKHTGWWIFDNPYEAIYFKPFVNPFTNARYEYQALEGQEFTGSTNPITDDSFFTISYLNDENQTKLLYMKFGGDNYVNFTSADEFMNDDRQIAQGGRSVTFNYYCVDFFAYYLYNSIQKLPLGTNGTYTFEFGNDMFQYFEVNEDGSFGEEILNEDRDAIIKTFKGIRSNIKESLKQNGTQPWGNQLKSLFNNLDYYIGLNATSHNSNKAFGAAKLKTTTEGNKVKKTVNTSAPLTVIVDDYVTDLLDKHIIGKYFKVLNVEEYENKYFAMQYAFMSKRENTPGAEWNASRRYFTLPASINQNFIMSDFRAMVVGGAHFDNNCFVQSRSVGVFIQDNLEVSKSFLEIVTGYLDVVKEQQLDVKMGKYLVAYYKVIYYLYGLKKIQKFNYFYLEMLYRNLSDIKNFIDENDLINQIEKADNENILNINNNNSQTIDNSLMKDFVIQLKRIGESNYKFYETQKPAKKGQASNNNDNSKGGDVQEAQPVQDNSTATATATATTESDNKSSVKFGGYKSANKGNNEIPVLLGSLIYDEHWFKSTIDDE